MTKPALFVNAAVLAHLEALPARPWEVGGWLLGFWADDRRSLFVTHATPPRRGTPWKVTISGNGHRRYFDEARDASDGDVTFLGDWHTHPGVPGTPSRRDRRALKKLATDPESHGSNKSDWPPWRPKRSKGKGVDPA